MSAADAAAVSKAAAARLSTSGADGGGRNNDGSDGKARNGGKHSLNLVLLGQHGAGKSTVLGHLLYKLGLVDRRVLERYEREAAEALPGRRNVKYSWTVDTLKTERERGMSVAITTVKFETPRFNVTALDPPGHKDFMKTLVGGTAQADVGLLVVSAADGETEDSLDAQSPTGGCTVEHAMLAYTLGIRQLVVAVNKMDAKVYSEERYQAVQEKVSAALKKQGFKPEGLTFLPLSGLQGDNLVEASGNLAWFRGAALLEVLDGLDPPVQTQKLADRPLRLPLQDVYKIGGIGTVPTGRVEAGVLRPGMQLAICPGGLSTEVKSVEWHHETVAEALPGDNVGFSVRGVAVSALASGFVASDAQRDPAVEAESFLAQIRVVSHPGRLCPGYTPVVDVHTAHVPCRFRRLLAIYDKKTGAEAEKDPKFITAGQVALVELQPMQPLCVEAYHDYPSLGRIVVRDLKTIVAVGVVKSVQRVQR